MLNPNNPEDVLGDMLDVLGVSVEEIGRIVYNRDWEGLDVLIRLYLFDVAWEEAIIEYCTEYEQKNN